MSDHDPTVMRRVMALRQIPAFSRAALDELATLADNAREVSFVPGAVVAPAGARIPTLQLVIEGRIEMADPSSPTGGTLTWGPHEVFGALEVLAGRKCARRAVAAVATRTLQLSGIEFAELLDDNLGLLLSMMRELARNVIARGGSVAMRSAAATFAKEPLGLVERLILLRRQGPFGKAHLQALAMLAQLSEEITWPAGAEIVRSGELATNVIAIIEGELRTSGEAYSADAIGLVETVAALPHVETIRAATPVRALMSSNIALFDTLEDHTEMGLVMLGSFASALLDAPCVPDPAHVN
jgi:CRP-like cAMP-binding protein